MIDDDPQFLQTRRDAFILLALWGACLIWSVGVSYLYGYEEHPRVPVDVTWVLPDLRSFDRSASEMTTPGGLGIPDWAVWGVLVPWIVCILFSVWFALLWMREPRDSPDHPHLDAKEAP